MPKFASGTIDLVTADDATQIYQYHDRNKAHLSPWEPARDQSYHTLEAWQARAAAQQGHNAKGTSYHFAIKLHGQTEVAGLCNFNNVVRGAFLACHLGYSVDERHQGKGVMFDALSTIIPLVFNEFGLHRIMANYMPANARSGRLLQRLGFVREGYARD